MWNIKSQMRPDSGLYLRLSPPCERETFTWLPLYNDMWPLQARFGPLLVSPPVAKERPLLCCRYRAIISQLRPDYTPAKAGFWSLLACSPVVKVRPLLCCRCGAIWDTTRHFRFWPLLESIRQLRFWPSLESPPVVKREAFTLRSLSSDLEHTKPHLERTQQQKPQKATFGTQ